MNPSSFQCQHGQQHYHHQHHHAGLAEGLQPIHTKKLRTVLFLSIAYLVLQLSGGFLSGSLALFADAGHKIADVAYLALALLASWFAHLSTSPSKTFGYHRLEILAALINALALLVIGSSLIMQAYHRLFQANTVEIEGGLMLGVALGGLLINLIAAKVLYPARELNLNVKGALFHLLADILNSFGEIFAAGAILLFHWMWADSLISVIIAGIILLNAFRLLKEALNILMESAPRHLPPAAIHDFICAQPGVQEVHDIHIWTITTGKDALLAHVRTRENEFSHELARELEKQLRDTFHFCHITLQLEPHDFCESHPPF